MSYVKKIWPVHKYSEKQADGSGDSNTPKNFIYGGKIKRPDDA